MYTNQYLITTKCNKITSKELSSVEFADMLIYAHPKLNVTIVNNPVIKIALIGYIINPFKPSDTNIDIIANLACACTTKDELFKQIELYSGRFVLLYKTDESFIITGDACHFRQIYYSSPGNDLVITSSPRLYLDSFKYELQITQEKLKISSNPNYLVHESHWYGDESIDDRLYKLLPNFYLDISRKEMFRRPFFCHEFSDVREVIDYASLILRNTFKTLSNRYSLMQPLTAGWDSRILLAASREYKSNIRYYIFDNFTGSGPDGWVPGNLKNKLKIDFRVIQPAELREDFLSKFKKEHVITRVLPKTAHIQHHFDCNYPEDVVNINGNCTEILRCYYGYTSKKISFDMLLAFAASSNRSQIDYFREQLLKWYPGASRYSEENCIALLDLFYWEQKLGNWGAMWPFEQDIAVEEISPFNNRSLISSILGVSADKRRSPDYSFFRDLIKNLWEEVLSEPINPGENYIKQIINGNSRLKYMGIKIKSIFLY
jgi:hypothetical protein